MYEINHTMDILVRRIEVNKKIIVNLMNPGYLNEFHCSFPAQCIEECAVYPANLPNLTLATNEKYYSIKTKQTYDVQPNRMIHRSLWRRHVLFVWRTSRILFY